MAKVSREEMVAHGIGSIIIGMMAQMENSKYNGSFITLFQYIRNHTIKRQKKLSKSVLISLSNICRETILELDSGDNIALCPATYIESLAYSFENEMRIGYGEKLFLLLDRFSLKHGLTSGAKDGYKTADSTRDIFRKKVFDMIKETI